MDKQLTQDQKHTLMILEELEKNAWRKMILGYIEWNIKERESILNWDKGIQWLDDIKYSQNSIIRAERAMLKAIADYTTHIKKTTGVYQAGS